MTARALRNAAAWARLSAAAPEGFPAEVLAHAEAHRWVPALPRLAVESYWAAHPVRADRLARALAALSGAPYGWQWRADAGARETFRDPPAPFRNVEFMLGAGRCQVCGQPVFRFGWHRDLWGSGPNLRVRWHAACVAAWKLWVAPNSQLKMLGRLQGRRCAQSGIRLLRDAEVDHRVPLVRIWREERDRPWPELLAYWGFPNLQALNAPAHRAKTAHEASARAALRLEAAARQRAST
ncbi:MAG: hypothetical protein INR65_15835 [Gluconacetobacter diazotrophicus]|nr:hypothetical protein [Gluconacetobacter diazotrophicus]